MAKIFGNTLTTPMNPDKLKNENGTGGAVKSVNDKTGDVKLTAKDVGALEENLRPNVMMAANKNDVYTKAETKQFVEDSINSSHQYVILPAINNKANVNLSNVDNDAFLAKLNEVLPDGDEVSY